jgi:hypothetical protein
MRSTALLRIFAALTALALTATAGIAQADTIPQYYPVQGHLVDSTGYPLTGTHALTFSLYDAETGGLASYSENHGTVTFSMGQFYARFGSGGDAAADAGTDAGMTLDMAVFDSGTDYWLEIMVDNQKVIEPRLRMGSLPYVGFAMNSKDSMTISGKLSAEFAPAVHPLGWGEITGVPAAIADGDNDTMGTLACASPGNIPKYGTHWECLPVAQAPAEMLIFVEGACPAGWAEFTQAAGRTIVGLPAGGTLLGTVGTPLSNGENRAHTHPVDFPSHTSSSQAGHTHSFNPASQGVSSAGDHAHTTTGPTGTEGYTSQTSNCWAASNGHTHASSTNGSHTHTVDVGLAVSASSPAHSHTLDYPATNTGEAKTGDALPYFQLRACRKN